MRNEKQLQISLVHHLLRFGLTQHTVNTLQDVKQSY